MRPRASPTKRARDARCREHSRRSGSPVLSPRRAAGRGGADPAGKRPADNRRGRHAPDGLHLPAGMPRSLVVGGLSRHRTQRRRLPRLLADRDCLLVVAPLFDKRGFPRWRYQRGGIVRDGVVQKPGDWTGRLALVLVDWVRRREGKPLPYSLLAHSAGAQFLDRLAAFVPSEAKRIVVANPGSYVFPSLEIAAPYGLGEVYASAHR